MHSIKLVRQSAQLVQLTELKVDVNTLSGWFSMATT